MKPYKFTFVGKNSDLEKALAHDAALKAAGKDTRRTKEVVDSKTGKKTVEYLSPLSEHVYDETTKRYEAMYSAEDRAWFDQWQKSALKNAKANPKAY